MSLRLVVTIFVLVSCTVGICQSADLRSAATDSDVENVLSLAGDNVQILEDFVNDPQSVRDSPSYIPIFRRLKELRPHSLDFPISLARCYTKARMDESALEEIRSILRADPNSAITTSGMLTSLGHYQEALDSLYRAKAIDPSDTNLCDLEISKVLWVMGRRQEAWTMLQQTSKRMNGPATISHWMTDLFYVYFHESDYDGMAGMLVDAEVVGGAKLCQDLMRETIISCQMDDMEVHGFISAVKRRIVGKPQLVESRLSLARICIKGGRTELAEATLMDVLSIARNRPTVLRRVLKEWETSLYRLPAAEVEANRLLAHLFPKDPTYMCNLAWIYWRRGSAKEGIRYARMIMKRWPHDFDATYKAGVTFDKLGHLEEAVPAYKAAMALDKEHWDWPMIEYAGICARTGRRKEAIRLLAQLERRGGYSDMSPDDLYSMADVYDQLGQSGKAARCRSVASAQKREARPSSTQ